MTTEINTREDCERAWNELSAKMLSLLISSTDLDIPLSDALARFAGLADSMRKLMECLWNSQPEKQEVAGVKEEQKIEQQPPVKKFWNLSPPKA